MGSIEQGSPLQVIASSHAGLRQLYSQKSPMYSIVFFTASPSSVSAPVKTLSFSLSSNSGCGSHSHLCDVPPPTVFFTSADINCCSILLTQAPCPEQGIPPPHAIPQSFPLYPSWQIQVFPVGSQVPWFLQTNVKTSGYQVC